MNTHIIEDLISSGVFDELRRAKSLDVTAAALLTTGASAPVGTRGMSTDTPPQFFDKVGAGNTEWEPCGSLLQLDANLEVVNTGNTISATGPRMGKTADGKLVYKATGTGTDGWEPVLVGENGEFVVNIQLEDTGSITLGAGTLALNSSGQLILHTGSATGDELTPIGTGGGGGAYTLLCKLTMGEKHPATAPFGTPVGNTLLNQQTGTSASMHYASGFLFKPTETFDAGNHWDAATFTFTAPAAGNYQFTFPARVYNNMNHGSAQTIRYGLIINGTSFYPLFGTPRIDASTAIDILERGAYTVSLALNDTVKFAMLSEALATIGSGSYSVFPYNIDPESYPISKHLLIHQLS